MARDGTQGKLMRHATKEDFVNPHTRRSLCRGFPADGAWTGCYLHLIAPAYLASGNLSPLDRQCLSSVRSPCAPPRY